jgi:CRISPR-associated protein Csc3
MSHARKLVDVYRQFYRARRLNSNSILRPLSVAARAVLSADRRLFDREGLTEAVRGELRAFMERVQTGSADGIFPRGSARDSREAAMREFAEYFVGRIFYETFHEDVAALRGKQLNLLKNAVEVLYRDASARDRQEDQSDNEDLENGKQE